MIFLFRAYLRLSGLGLKLVNSIIFWFFIVLLFNFKSNFILKKLYELFSIIYIFNIEIDLLIFRLMVSAIIYCTILFLRKSRVSFSFNLSYYEYISLLDLILGENKLIRAINLLLLIALNLYCIYFVLFFGMTFELGYLENNYTSFIFLSFLIIFITNVLSIPSIDLIRLYETEHGFKPIAVPIKYIRPNIFYVLEYVLSVARRSGINLSKVMMEKPPLKPSQEVLEREMTRLREVNQGLNKQNLELQERLRASHMNAIVSGGSLLLTAGGLICAIKNTEYAAEQLEEAKKIGTADDPNALNTKRKLDQQGVLIEHNKLKLEQQNEMIQLGKAKVSLQKEELKLARQRSDEVLNTIKDLRKEFEDLKKTNKGASKKSWLW